jgi:hypothetical protein
MRIALLGLLLANAWRGFAAEPTSEQLEYFEKIIRPLLAQQCYECHSTKHVSGASSAKGGLVLDLKDGWTQGGVSGPLRRHRHVVATFVWIAVVQACRGCEGGRPGTGAALQAG